MRPLLILVLALVPGMSPAQTITDIDWQLLAINGAITESGTTLRIGVDGALTGAAPCNSWSSTNAATLPALELRGIRATRRACNKLADEKLFFDTLSAMTTMALEGDRNLVLTGPDGRSMEFVIERTVCRTCRTGG